ncbi:MAG: hypothetical protein RLZ12_787 [Bacillota bacterium]
MKVRLSACELEAIKLAFKTCFLPEDHLWLFGSRTDLSQKGGDIDLYIETEVSNVKQVLAAKSRFVTELYRSIGEQKIDVVVKLDKSELPIYKVAKKEGVHIEQADRWFHYRTIRNALSHEYPESLELTVENLVSRRTSFVLGQTKKN